MKFTYNLLYTSNLHTPKVYSLVSFDPMNNFIHNSILSLWYSVHHMCLTSLNSACFLFSSERLLCSSWSPPHALWSRRYLQESPCLFFFSQESLLCIVRCLWTFVCKFCPIFELSIVGGQVECELVWLETEIEYFPLLGF